jgi:zinc finger HIT domain-containing protein 1
VLLEESGIYEGKLPEPHYWSSEATPSSFTAKRTFCAVCGNFAKYRCTRCREPNCGLRCLRTHNELRCLKFAW